MEFYVHGEGYRYRSGYRIGSGICKGQGHCPQPVSYTHLDVYKRQRYAYELVPADSAAVQASMETVLTEYLHSLVDPYGTVKSTLFTVRSREGTAVLTAECQEEIGPVSYTHLDVYKRQGGALHGDLFL